MLADTSSRLDLNSGTMIDLPRVRGSTVDSRATSGLVALWSPDDGASRKVVSLSSKENNKPRLILDACRANTRFLPPPRVELVSTERLNRIEFGMTHGECSVLVLWNR